MTIFKRMPYSRQLRLRVWGLRLLIVVMLVYAVFVAMTGGGDSRIVTDAAHSTMVTIYFGGLVWIGWRIHRLKQLLRDPGQMKERLLEERDERRRYIHDKSGGIVWDVLFVCLLFITLHASLYNMTAFAVAQVILLLTIALKLAAWAYYSRN